MRPPDTNGGGRGASMDPGLDTQQTPQPSRTANGVMLPHGGTSDDPRRIGELLATWLGIQLDTVDSLTAEAQAKVAAIPNRQVLLTLLGELIVRLGAVELEVADLQGGRR